VSAPIRRRRRSSPHRNRRDAGCSPEGRDASSPLRRFLGRGRDLLAAVAVSAACCGLARAQNPPAAGFDVDPAWAKTVDRDDYREWHIAGGFRFSFPELKLTIRGGNALMLTDLEESHAAIRGQSAGGGLPRRSIELPEPRRRLSNDQIRERLARAVSAVSQTDAARVDAVRDQFLDVPRYLYCEDGVVVVRDGVEVLRCDRLWISPVDDRVVVENFELRYAAAGRSANDLLIVRGPKLVKQGARWTGRDVTLTTCSAGEPHYALASDEIEIIEREGEFEVRARGQSLQVGGTSLIPLPNAHVFTGSQSQFPIRLVRASYSPKEGVSTQVVFGLPWNSTGGALHHWLTGRPAQEFRGDWELGVGWIQERGVPLDGMLDYRVPGLYEGRTEGFFLDDSGEDLHEITTNIDGSAIPPGPRGVVRSQNRVHLGPTTHLDLVAWYGSDAAVWSEFFNGPYRNEEVPETSAYLHHADGNRLLTVGTRFDLSPFSYRDDRALADRFIEEEPVVTYHWIAQPIGTTPWDTPVVVDMATEVGQRRSDYDDRAGVRVSDRTLRADQLVELSAPFHLAGFNVRPFVSGRGTFYDNTVAGDSEGRIALTTGVQLGTRFSRTWSWLEGGEAKGVRHVIAPKISFLDRFHVDDSASDFFQFDEIDALAEEQLVRFEVRNLLQSMEATPKGGKQPRDFVLLDLAQDLYPDKARDNGGDTLGLFYYDLLLRPRVHWLPFETFTYAIYGDHDWQKGLRTLDTELQFGKLLGLTWTLDYRTDTQVNGAVGVATNASLLDRWDMYVSSQRDLDRDVWLAYNFGLRRNDHDWAIELSASYNPFEDQTNFKIEFLPRLGSFSNPRGSRFGGFDGPGQFATSY